MSYNDDFPFGDLDKWLEGHPVDYLDPDYREEDGINCHNCDQYIPDDSSDAVFRYRGSWLCERCYLETPEGIMYLRANEDLEDIRDGNN